MKKPCLMLILIVFSLSSFCSDSLASCKTDILMKDYQEQMLCDNDAYNTFNNLTDEVKSEKWRELGDHFKLNAVRLKEFARKNCPKKTLTTDLDGRNAAVNYLKDKRIACEKLCGENRSVRLNECRSVCAFKFISEESGYLGFVGGVNGMDTASCARPAKEKTIESLLNGSNGPK